MNTLLIQLTKKIAAGILLTIIFSIICFAGNNGKIAGRLTDKANGEPLIGANVYIKGLKLGASTDIQGDYFILNIPPGTYTLTASMIGYSVSSMKF